MSRVLQYTPYEAQALRYLSVASTYMVLGYTQAAQHTYKLFAHICEQHGIDEAYIVARYKREVATLWQ